MKTRCSERGLNLEDWKKTGATNVHQTISQWLLFASLVMCLVFHRLAASQPSSFTHWKPTVLPLITKSPGLKRLGLQGVVSYMSRVEVFVTGIKIESSNQSPFWELIKVTSKLRKSKDLKHAAPIRPLTCKKSSGQELLKGRSSDQAIKHTFWQSNLDPGHKCFNRWHISDYPLNLNSWLL